MLYSWRPKYQQDSLSFQSFFPVSYANYTSTKNVLHYYTGIFNNNNIKKKSNGNNFTLLSKMAQKGFREGGGDHRSDLHDTELPDFPEEVRLNCRNIFTSLMQSS